MFLHRRSLIAFLVVIAFISLLCFAVTACQKGGKETVPLLANETLFHKGVGKMVPTGEALQWTANLQRKSRGAVTSFTIPADAIRTLLKEEGCVGILFYYGKQNGEKIVLLPVAIRANGSVIKKETLHSTAGLAKWEVARSWKQKYEGAVKGHFEGAFILEQLLSSGFGTLRISTGLTDAGEEKNVFL